MGSSTSVPVPWYSGFTAGSPVIFDRIVLPMKSPTPLRPDVPCTSAKCYTEPYRRRLAALEGKEGSSMYKITNFTTNDDIRTLGAIGPFTIVQYEPWKVLSLSAAVTSHPSRCRGGFVRGNMWLTIASCSRGCSS